MERPLVLLTLSGLLSLMLAGSAQAADANQLTSEERTIGFRLLFNGRDLQDWHHEGNWMIQDGTLVCTKHGGTLVCRTLVVSDNFELRFEWKVGNQVDTATALDGTLTLETRWPTIVPGQSGRERFRGQAAYFYETGGGRIGMVSEEVPFGDSPPTTHALFASTSPNKSASRPVGHWNTARIIWSEKSVQHWLNGQKIVEKRYASVEGAPEELRQRAQSLADTSMVGATQCRKHGLHLEIEDWGSPLCYRGIKLCEHPPSHPVAGR
jgi:hypothetical protein